MSGCEILPGSRISGATAALTSSSQPAIFKPLHHVQCWAVRSWISKFTKPWEIRHVNNRFLHGGERVIARFIYPHRKGPILYLINQMRYMHCSFSPEAALIKWERQHNVKLGEGGETEWNDESSQWTSVVIQEGKLPDEIFHVRLATMPTSHSTDKHSGTHGHLNALFCSRHSGRI